ncbi:hypothetical protein OIU76_019934 [Salix suchowensis]|nr:hypothetical protein OIU76_019934 [Salix suchowensis]
MECKFFQALGLRVIGVKPDEKLALFADNSYRWLVADQGMMAMGAVDVVRGPRSSVEELLQIYNHSERLGVMGMGLKDLEDKETRDTLIGKIEKAVLETV